MGRGPGETCTQDGSPALGNSRCFKWVVSLPELYPSGMYSRFYWEVNEPALCSVDRRCFSSHAVRSANTLGKLVLNKVKDKSSQLFYRHHDYEGSGSGKFGSSPRHSVTCRCYASTRYSRFLYSDDCPGRREGQNRHHLAADADRAGRN